MVVGTGLKLPASFAGYWKHWRSVWVVVSLSSECSLGRSPKNASASAERIESDSDAGHRLIVAFGSLAVDCRSILDTSAGALVPVDEHTLAGHDHVFGATRPTPEKPTGACGRSGGKVVACVRLPRP